MFIREFWKLLIVASLFVIPVQCVHAQQDEATDQAEAQLAEVVEAQLEEVEAVEFLGIPKLKMKGAPPKFVKPLVNAELSFVKRVCSPSSDQMKEIVHAAKAAYMECSDLVADGPMNAQGRANKGWILRGPNNEQLKENPYLRVRRDAHTYLKPILSPAQYQSYIEEAAERDRFERETAIGLAIGMLDDRIGLTQTQYDELTKVLLKEWKEIDLQWIFHYTNNNEYMPPIPKPSLNKVLTKKQQKMLESIQNIRIMFGWNNGFGANIALKEEWLK
ncbi:hypothetical protein [Rhodopirellula sallentina]|uniref:Signal peptide protein n=1 Tax=Rhodopirellula sallentina SM41 TaxID=1263870 RepID=M5U9B9_9BACT|nr:hypothetical protein [Rhodopirellula sallentina]EMI57879.1 signal peptide protein [Rhodopirellula sallentina SM41]